MDKIPKIAAIIVAAGRGARAPGDVPKQYRKLGDKSVLAHTLAAFRGHNRIDSIILVTNPDDKPLYDALNLTGITVVEGGETRTQSVLNGIHAAEAADHVLIHDAARPFVSKRIITQCVEDLKFHPAAVPVLPIVDAIKHVYGETLKGDADRSDFVRMQTPQAFHKDKLLDAIASVDLQKSFQDDIAIALAAGLDVALVRGDENNFKLTFPSDFDRAERLLMSLSQSITISGSGFDVHQFTDGDHVMICGVRIDAPFGLLGHSDADVGLHAVTDALLGACSLGDIGDHFPPSDPQWSGQASDLFLEHAIALAAEQNAKLVHVDVTIIGEQPKVKPHREAMRVRLSKICDLPLARISVKATTTEGLGFTGRNEGLAAMATVTVSVPS